MYVYQSSLICISLILHVLTVYLACKTKLNIFYTAVIYPSFHCVQLPVGYTTRNKTFFFYCSSIFWQMLLSVCAATQNCILKKNISIQEDHHKVTIADIASWYLIPFAFTTRQNSTKVNIKIHIPIEASWLS